MNNNSIFIQYIQIGKQTNKQTNKQMKRIMTKSERENKTDKTENKPRKILYERNKDKGHKIYKILL